MTAYVQPCVSVCDATTACQASIGPTLASMNFSAPLPDLLNPLCNATIVPTAQYVGGQPLFGDTVWRVGGASFPVQCQTIRTYHAMLLGFACLLLFLFPHWMTM